MIAIISIILYTFGFIGVTIFKSWILIWLILLETFQLILACILMAVHLNPIRAAKWLIKKQSIDAYSAKRFDPDWNGYYIPDVAEYLVSMNGYGTVIEGEKNIRTSLLGKMYEDKPSVSTTDEPDWPSVNAPIDEQHEHKMNDELI